ncbi:16S rRNA (uracil(1498)-N(3))-methyltransferase [Longispora albida]|uniref:16S rRNA (uracil(1498)-N(3))-methyltransferase n=1 Tax=Longispora albida TaxID=203523 RepID=UPI00036F24F1|nr:16S rRNA (uracil(1498)-N(3))-methyltransferase [Longispora albida]
MSLPLFLCASVPAAGQVFRLDGPEGKHAADVQRLRAGERLLLGDGQGARAVCVVIAAHKGALDLRVEQYDTEPAPSPRLIVVQGLPKGDRAELAVQAMTEVGVDEIIPWHAARAITHWKGERGAKSLEKWRAVAREAGKQSRRMWFPVVSGLHATAQIAPTFVLHEEADVPLSTVPLPAGDLTIVVGPEGGIDPAEVLAFADKGAIPVRLGPTVLRTSTAGVAALSILSARLRRW